MNESKLHICSQYIMIRLDNNHNKPNMYVAESANR